MMRLYMLPENNHIPPICKEDSQRKIFGYANHGGKTKKIDMRDIPGIPP
jgi:hypothetical protein